MENITYFVTIHDKYSLDFHKNKIKEYKELEKVPFQYICGVNPDKTDLYNLSQNIICCYDKHDIFCQMNRIFRFKTTLMYILKHLDLVKTDYISIEGCTTFRTEREEYSKITPNVFYTTIRSTKGFFKNISTECGNYYKKHFEFDINFDTKMFCFDYVIFHKNIAEKLYNFLYKYMMIIVNNKPGKYWLPELFDSSLYYNYDLNYRDIFDVSSLKFKFRYISSKVDKKIHFYGG